MISKILSKIACCAILALMILTSCTKEEIETSSRNNQFYKMNANGTEMISDVIAIHCETDSSNIYQLTNNVDLINSGTVNYVEGDFRIFMNIIAGDEHKATGNHGLGIEFTDENGMTIVRSSADLTITFVDDQLIEGTASGFHYKPNPANNDMIEFPFTMEFSAEILETNDFCQ